LSDRRKEIALFDEFCRINKHWAAPSSILYTKVSQYSFNYLLSSLNQLPVYEHQSNDTFQPICSFRYTVKLTIDRHST